MTTGRKVDDIRYVYHRGFSQRHAEIKWGPIAEDVDTREKELGYMPDEITRDFAKRMHYAAFRADRAGTRRERTKWFARYFDLRDRVVLGNRKLIFRAVRRKIYQNQADDLIGECYVVMIRAVAAFNPFLNIRFSTYAFTCLMRALSRLSQRSAADKLSQHLSLDAVHPEAIPELATSEDVEKIQTYLADDHPLLNEREKMVLTRRFQLHHQNDGKTLEEVGRDLGISKERVRQVQASAIEKLKDVMV